MPTQMIDEPRTRTLIPPGVTLYELWHQAGGYWIECEQPVYYADGDGPIEEPDEEEYDEEQAEAVARMLNEGGGQHHD